MSSFRQPALGIGDLQYPYMNTDTPSVPHCEPSFARAVSTVVAVVVLISIGLFAFAADLRLLLAIALAGVAVSAAVRVTSPLIVARTMVGGIVRARVALVIFALIGILIAVLIQAGTVPTLIEWGIRAISPAWFLPAALVLCCIMSLATGTAWGTAGTIGVVLMTIGAHMGLPLGLVAGVVVSGACFGDKMSLVSDTTNLASMSAGTDIYRHIRSMFLTTAPTFVIVLVTYWVAGKILPVHPLDEADLNAFSSALSEAAHLGWVTLLPLAVLIVLSMARLGAITTMAGAILAAVVLALTYQGVVWGQLVAAMWHGQAGTSEIPALNDLLSRGGLTSMFFTMVISLLALALGALLNELGYMRAIIGGLLARVRQARSLVPLTIASAFLGNITTGEAYMSIVLGGQLFQEKYDDEGIDRAVLSRSLEEGATLTTPLIPWTTAGVFFASTLGVSTAAYVPFAWLNLLNPLMGMLFAVAGWGLLHRRN